MKQIGRFGLWVPEDTDAPDGPTQIGELAESINEALGRAGAQSKKTAVAAEQLTESTSFVLLGTADRVQGIELPTDGLIVVGYVAKWKSSVAAAGRAAIFLDENNLKNPIGAEAASVSTTGTGFNALSSSVGIAGLASSEGTTAFATTGTPVAASPTAPCGGLCCIFAAAGTYDVSVRYRVTSGSVSAKERKLWVWTQEFI